MVVHTGRKDFLCQYCAQRFGRKDHLTRHVKKSHARELLRVKTEPVDTLEPVVYDLGVKGELPAVLTTRPHQLNMYTDPNLDTEPLPNPAYPFSLKYPGGPNFTSLAVSSHERDHGPKGELESYLMELQSATPSSSTALSQPQLTASKLQMEPHVGALDEPCEDVTKLSSAPPSVGDPLVLSSSLMDFSQLFNYLPLNGPPYNQVGVGSGQGATYTPNEEITPLNLLPPQPIEGPEAADSHLAGGLTTSFTSNLSSPTTLPRFHQAFQ